MISALNAVDIATGEVVENLVASLQPDSYKDELTLDYILNNDLNNNSEVEELYNDLVQQIHISNGKIKANPG